MEPVRRIRVLANQVVSLGSGGFSPSITSPGTSSPGERRTRIWDHEFLEKPEPGTVALVGAPLCEGQGLRGVNLAPDAFRSGGLEAVVSSLKWGFVDHGDVQEDAIAVATAAAVERRIPTGVSEDDYYPLSMVKNSFAVGAGVGAVYEKVAAAAQGDNFVLTVGGDHSIAAGSITAIAQERPDVAIIWVDAHGDCNTPDTSPSGNYHGMPLGHVMGWFEKRVHGFEWCDDHIKNKGAFVEDRIALLALRDVDPEERELLRKSGIHVFTMYDIDRHGIGAVMEMALDRVDPKQRRPLHLSFDIDSCDPVIAPGTGTKARGGLSYREAHYICERLAVTQRLGSMDLVEVNPQLDEQIEERMHGDNPDIKGTETVRFGIELVASALGQTII